jgi:hypothetical protein
MSSIATPKLYACFQSRYCPTTEPASSIRSYSYTISALESRLRSSTHGLLKQLASVRIRSRPPCVRIRFVDGIRHCILDIIDWLWQTDLADRVVSLHEGVEWAKRKGFRSTSSLAALWSC